MNEINCNPENISNRICAELDLTLARNLNKELECKLQQLKAENIKFTLDSKKLVAQYSAKLERLKQTLQDIKAIAESAMAKQQEYKKDFEQILDFIKQAKEGGE